MVLLSSYDTDAGTMMQALALVPKKACETSYFLNLRNAMVSLKVPLVSCDTGTMTALALNVM